jgi:hypothetical protein
VGFYYVAATQLVSLSLSVRELYGMIKTLGMTRNQNLVILFLLI